MTRVRIQREGEPENYSVLDGVVVSFGRSPENDIALDDGRVSGKHGHFEKRDGRWFVIDLSSSNGTLVNGETVDPGGLGRALENGDRITIGPYHLLYDVPALISGEEREGDEEALHSFPADEKVKELRVALHAAFAESIDLAPEAREARLRAVLAEHTGSWPKRHVAEVVGRLVQGLDRGGSASGQATEEELDRFDKVFRASHEAMMRLSESMHGQTRLENEEEVRRLGALLGQSLQSLVEFLASCLRGRGEWHNEFDPQITMIQGLAKNPLKDDPRFEAIAPFLFDTRSPLEPRVVKRLLDEAILDLHRHHLALVPSARGAAEELLAALSPERIEERHKRESSGLRRMLGSVWETYLKTHEELRTESQLLYEKIEPGIKRGYQQAHLQRKDGGPPKA